jgi:DNA polymerase III delta prime subunit
MGIELPKKKRPVTKDLGGQSILLYGPHGIGKTTFANELTESTLFIATEEGQSFLECYHQSCQTWKQYLEILEALRDSEDRYKAFAVDTVDNLYNHCAYFVGKKHGFDHASDEDWGKGYQLIREEFQRGLNRLLSFNKGVVLISHSQDREIKTRVSTITKTMPTMPGSARRVILPLVSVIIYAGFKWVKDEKTGEKIEKRVAIMKPSETLEAKDRTGRLPEVLPLRAARFIKAYRGE